MQDQIHLVTTTQNLVQNLSLEHLKYLSQSAALFQVSYVNQSRNTAWILLDMRLELSQGPRRRITHQLNN